MSTERKSYSIIRLNSSDNGWGVVDDATGALVHTDGLALRLTKESARSLADNLNAAEIKPPPPAPDAT